MRGEKGKCGVSDGAGGIGNGRRPRVSQGDRCYLGILMPDGAQVGTLLYSARRECVACKATVDYTLSARKCVCRTTNNLFVVRHTVHCSPKPVLYWIHMCLFGTSTCGYWLQCTVQDL